MTLLQEQLKRLELMFLNINNENFDMEQALNASINLQDELVNLEKREMETTEYTDEEINDALGMSEVMEQLNKLSIRK